MNQLFFDLVYQATGQHAHAVSDGIENTLRNLGILGKVFRPHSNWGDKEPLNDDGLFDYLINPTSQAVVFLGFDWHSQCLHRSPRWRTRINNCPVIKIAHTHETLFNGHPEEVRLKTFTFLSAISLVDSVWHTSRQEEDLIKNLLREHKLLKHIFSTGFSVDTGFFTSGEAISNRRNFAFFRGKTKAFTHESQYQERRDIIASLPSEVHIKDYSPNEFSNRDLALEYQDYQICIDLPSVFAGATTRVYEALASGCFVCSKESNFTPEEIEQLSPMLIIYKDKNDLLGKLSNIYLYLSFDYGVDIQRIRNQISLSNDIAKLSSFVLHNLSQVTLARPAVTIYDHPYHLKTQSQLLVLNHIYENYDTTTIYADNLTPSIAEAASRLEVSSNRPVVYWQSMIHAHNQKIRSSQSDRPVLIFPMFDNSNHMPDDSFPTNCKYVCFSSTIHDRLLKLGMTSVHTKYFPDERMASINELEHLITITRERSTKRELVAYFWHRTNFIQIQQVVQMSLALGCHKLILKDHPDPGVNKYNEEVLDDLRSIIDIQVSSWHHSKIEALQELMQCDIYFAPRPCEGIGLGFLEAMSLAICPVSFDAPTMNEYIKNGYTGILYNKHSADNPINGITADIFKIRLNIKASIEEWIDQWINHKTNIIDIFDNVFANNCQNSLVSCGANLRSPRHSVYKLER